MTNLATFTLFLAAFSIGYFAGAVLLYLKSRRADQAIQEHYLQATFDENKEAERLIEESYGPQIISIRRALSNHVLFVFIITLVNIGTAAWAMSLPGEQLPMVVEVMSAGGTAALIVGYLHSGNAHKHINALVQASKEQVNE